MHKTKGLVKVLKKSYWLKSGTLVLTTRVSLMALGFSSFLILIRSLDKREFGLWVIFMTITSLIETVRIGFLKSPLMILNSDQETDKSLLYTNSLYINLFTSFFIIVVIILAIPAWELFYGELLLTKLFYLYVIKLIIISFSDHFDLIQETNLEFKGSLFDLVSRHLIFVLLIIGFVIFNTRIELKTLVSFQIIGCFLGLFLTIINSYNKKIRVLTSLRFSKLYINKYIDLGKFTFGTSLISITSRNIDTWLLGILMTPVAVSIYNPALRISNIFEIPSSTIATVVMPKLTKKIGIEGIEPLKLYYERSVTYMLVIMLPIVIIVYFFSGEIIYLVAGNGFEQSGEILKITIFFGLLIPFIRQFTVVMESAGKPKTSFLVMIFTLIVSIISHYVFIRYFNVYGAAYGSLFTYLLAFILTQAYLHYHHDIRFWNVLLQVIPTAFKIGRSLKRIINYKP